MTEKQITIIFYFFCLFFHTACVGGTLGNTSEFEKYPLRAANTEESAALKRCLSAAYEAQENHKKETGSYLKKSSELPLDGVCQGFQLAQQRTATGYEIIAQFHENETTVYWTVNQDGVVEEHLDPEFEEDLEF